MNGRDGTKRTFPDASPLKKAYLKATAAMGEKI